MARVVKDAAAREEMCDRLTELIDNFYGGDVGYVAALMRYKTESTLRKALNERSSFPDVERLHFLLQSNGPTRVIPNMNWLVGGIDEPLLRMREGKIIGQLTFGKWLDSRPAARATPRRAERTKKLRSE